MATPVVKAPRSTDRTHRSETGPGCAPTNNPRPKPTSRALTPASRLRPAGLRELPLEHGQALVPLGAHLGHPRHRLRHRGGGGAVEHLAPGPAGGDEAGRRERAEVLL